MSVITEVSAAKADLKYRRLESSAKVVAAVGAAGLNNPAKWERAIGVHASALADRMRTLNRAPRVLSRLFGSQVKVETAGIYQPRIAVLPAGQPEYVDSVVTPEMLEMQSKYAGEDAQEHTLRDYFRFAAPLDRRRKRMPALTVTHRTEVVGATELDESDYTQYTVTLREDGSAELAGGPFNTLAEARAQQGKDYVAFMQKHPIFGRPDLTPIDAEVFAEYERLTTDPAHTLDWAHSMAAYTRALGAIVGARVALGDRIPGVPSTINGL